MTLKYSSVASRKLVMQLIMENIEFSKRSLYLQEIISLSKANDILNKMLLNFFEQPVKKVSLRSLCNN